MKYSQSGYKIDHNLQYKGYVSSRFCYIFMIRIKGKNEGVKIVYDQIDKSDGENAPYNMKLDSAFRTSFIQVSYDRTYPCKHCKQHEEKIQHAVKVQEGEGKICPVLFIKKTPANVCNKVKV